MDVVIVTGFGPFRGHNINASWEAVKLLPEIIEDVKIVTEEIPVIYADVESRVPQLWQKYSPKLVIHVGVKGPSAEITLESQAFRQGYLGIDCSGKKHPTGYICKKEDGQDCIKGTLDVDSICDFINKNCEIKACVSTNAGRYLCEFIYYSSLKINKDRTMFIHVPPLDQPYSAAELAAGITEVIKCALQQIQCECVEK